MTMAQTNKFLEQRLRALVKAWERYDLASDSGDSTRYAAAMARMQAEVESAKRLLELEGE